MLQEIENRRTLRDIRKLTLVIAIAIVALLTLHLLELVGVMVLVSSAIKGFNVLAGAAKPSGEGVS
jgi:hypothetical protein